ncbi:SDR family NAD(P)-dependent oxidoreductase [Sinomicrobium weinanense]|uniref:3-oxoacyl-ACP reductase FabG n=1 Tax=Sinomicrobium weinanense TaxID=2842200 RepID=A0A926Q405_9FLAO|nr:3-oxoacyl-ACP reductase family protein [Sinomicrobium weinanense]MBC9797469.1 3-oxoacyl-ACP reductase FabG [Sinomicrobium weinanense]MBU3124461.1 3-oxoacyl-ACP reductase FabG [Sinomicrobium weinanense]
MKNDTSISKHRQLHGKIAFVTGGSRGMGAAIVKRLASEGARVVFTHSGNHSEKAALVADEVKKAGGEAEEIVADNQSAEGVTTAIQEAISRYGKIDILVNNAGVFLYKPTQESTLEDFDRMMSVNVRAVFLAMKEAAGKMPEGGRIITIGSNVADRVGDPNMGLYGMSKSALIGLNKGMARELGSRDITVNLVQPGPIDTDMNPADSDMALELKKHIPVSRYGKAEEIAGLVYFLTGPESRFITGTSITIDGGFNS